jgi:hypothetical protein
MKNTNCDKRYAVRIEHCDYAVKEERYRVVVTTQSDPGETESYLTVGEVLSFLSRAGDIDPTDSIHRIHNDGFLQISEASSASRPAQFTGEELIESGISIPICDVESVIR